MSVVLNNIKLPLEAHESSLVETAAGALGIAVGDILALRVVRMSLDARKRQDIHHLCTLELSLAQGLEKRLLSRGVVGSVPEPEPGPEPGSTPLPAPIVVAGLGPAGLFAAYILAKHGYKPIVIERGQPAAQRVLDVERFRSGQGLNENSNVMFGEGGAGTFSDGKLTTRIKDARAREVIALLVRFGAPEQVAISAKPHVGTDRLVAIVGNIRMEIERLGGKVLFGARLCGLQTSGSVLSGIVAEQNGIMLRQECCACILATGQGARDVYGMLLGHGVALAPKPFAVGVRVEHPREFIDRAQFGAFAGHPRLGAAEYRLTARHGSRGVYTFCMCPGGEVIASSSAKGEVVTNGMSKLSRSAENSNAAIVVQVGPQDFGQEPLAGVAFQRALEERAFAAGGGGYAAPAQRVADFMAHVKGGFGGVAPSYRPGVVPAVLDECLPDFVAQGIRSAIVAFSSQLKGFDMPDAVLTAVESRTSSPVRVLRGADGEASIGGLFPVGEGAGYAGGIVSAAVDGIRAAEGLIRRYKPY